MALPQCGMYGRSLGSSARRSDIASLLLDLCASQILWLSCVTWLLCWCLQAYTRLGFEPGFMRQLDFENTVLPMFMAVSRAVQHPSKGWLDPSHSSGIEAGSTKLL